MASGNVRLLGADPFSCQFSANWLYYAHGLDTEIRSLQKETNEECNKHTSNLRNLLIYSEYRTRFKGILNFDANMANTNETNNSDSTERISQLLWMTAGPLVFFGGVIGNIIILIVLRRGKLSRLSITNLYVTLIAAADLLVLLIGMVNEWLKVNEPI